jgi:hypothetical protein
MRFAPSVCPSPEVGDGESSKIRIAASGPTTASTTPAAIAGSQHSHLAEDLTEVRCLSRARVDRVAETWFCSEADRRGDRVARRPASRLDLLASSRPAPNVSTRTNPRPYGMFAPAPVFAEPSTVPYATVSQHLNPLASAAAVARDPPRASLVHWTTEATAGFGGRVCGRHAQPAPQPPRR